MSTKRQKYTRDSLRYLEKIIGEKLTFSNLLKAIREAEEMSQVELADLLGVSRQYICDIEKGRRGVTPKTAAVMAEKLGYSEEQFVRLCLQDLLEREGFHYLVDLKVA